MESDDDDDEWERYWAREMAESSDEYDAKYYLLIDAIEDECWDWLIAHDYIAYCITGEPDFEIRETLSMIAQNGLTLSDELLDRIMDEIGTGVGIARQVERIRANKAAQATQ